MSSRASQKNRASMACIGESLAILLAAAAAASLLNKKSAGIPTLTCSLVDARHAAVVVAVRNQIIAIMIGVSRSLPADHHLTT